MRRLPANRRLSRQEKAPESLGSAEGAISRSPFGPSQAVKAAALSESCMADIPRIWNTTAAHQHGASKSGSPVGEASDYRTVHGGRNYWFTA
jgi:hypothetical protein